MGICDGESEETKNRVNHLRQLVSPHLTSYYDTHFNLLRWLQGHPGPIEETAKKLIAHLKMRAAWKLDEMINQPRDHEIHKHWVCGVMGVSSVMDNTVIFVDQTGLKDWWGMMQTHSISEIMRATFRDLEQMLADVVKLEEKTGRQAFILYVLDLTGIKYDARLVRLVTSELRSLSEFVAEHYVELIGKFVVLGAPSFANVLWQLAKPLLPEKTKQKVTILSNNNWREEMLNYADASLLPNYWSNDESKFSKDVMIPVKFSEEHYYQNKEPANISVVYVNAGRTVMLTKECQKGDKLTWWIAGSADHGFALYFSEDENENESIRMTTVHPCFPWMPGPTAVPINETVICERTGFYKFWLSNARAWFSRLCVRYEILLNGEEVTNNFA